MKQAWLWLSLALVLMAGPAFGETVHLKTGETIKGKIVKADDTSISVESDKGFGVIQVDRGDIVLIEYDETMRDPARTIGLGYIHRATPNSQTGRIVEYAVDAVSLKYWLSSLDSVDLAVGFFNNTDAGTKVLEVFSLDVRLAHVFKRKANLDLYYGGSAGYISVVDRTSGSNVDDTGTTLRAFLGAEIFFVTLPGLGIAAEVGVTNQTIGDRSTTNIATTTFPALSMRYYF